MTQSNITAEPMTDVQAQPATERQGWRVLVADDAVGNRLQLSVAIKAFDPSAQIFEAGDGAEAIEILTARNPDVAFVNVQLPDVTGAEALAFARAKGLRPITVLMSGLVMPRWIDLSAELAAYEFLKKPYDPEHVVHMLRGIRRMRTPIRLLLVSEMESSRALVRRILGSSGFEMEIEETESGRHALKLMRLTSYDVALVDANLSGMDGLETCAQAREAAPETKLMLMANSESGVLVQSARHFGVSSVLTKPFYARDVDVALHKAFGLRRPYLLNAMINAKPPLAAAAAR